MDALRAIAPYALVGGDGWVRYLFIVGILGAILSLLALSILLSKLLVCYCPRARIGVRLRLILDGGAGIAAMVLTFWP